MDRLEEIWLGLEKKKSLSAGLEKIRYSEKGRAEVYIGVKYPENYRLLLLRTTINNAKKIINEKQTKGIKLEKIYDTQFSDKIFLSLVLTNNNFKDIFDILINDIIDAIVHISDENNEVQAFVNRLEKWQNIFEQFNPVGLSSEEQRGLYGELFFIRKFLQNNSDFLSIINSWVGCEKQIRDFQSGSWSVEVKTTHGNNHQKVHVSSERQLDTSNLRNLFLYHLSIETRHQSGETLNQIVDSIYSILNSEFSALTRFRNKLLEGGYFGQHRTLYDNTGYFDRQENFYKVEKEFPRIEEKDILSGIGDVKYSIILSQCSNYLKSEQEIFSTLIFP